MNLAGLKKLAEERGVKKQGVGWAKCCPPDGNKDAIIKALEQTILPRAATSPQTEQRTRTRTRTAAYNRDTLPEIDGRVLTVESSPQDMKNFIQRFIEPKGILVKKGGGPRSKADVHRDIIVAARTLGLVAAAQ